MATQIILDPMPTKTPFIEDLGYPSSWIQWFSQLRNVVNLLSVRSVRAGTALIQDPIVMSNVLSGPHGIDGLPNYVTITLHCKAANLGYVAGDILVMGPYAQSQGGGTGMTAQVTATTLIVVKAAAFDIVNKGTFAVGTIAPASWRLEARAWALAPGVA